VCAILGEFSSLSWELSLAWEDLASRALLTEPKACRNKSAVSIDLDNTDLNEQEAVVVMALSFHKAYHCQRRLSITQSRHPEHKCVSQRPKQMRL
jgi:hypothetical protein